MNRVIESMRVIRVCVCACDYARVTVHTRVRVYVQDFRTKILRRGFVSFTGGCMRWRSRTRTHAHADAR